MHRFFLGLSKLMAILGGIVLSLLIVLICVSIVGRTTSTVLHNEFFQQNLAGLSQWLLDLGVGPVTGDYELVEAGIAFSIFAFLPYCQMTNGHASVDVFTNWLPKPVKRILLLVIEVVFAYVLIIIAQQLDAGMQSKLRSGQTTFLLQFPVWWAYAASLVGAIMAAVVGVYMVLVRAYEIYSGRSILGDEAGAHH